MSDATDIIEIGLAAYLATKTGVTNLVSTRIRTDKAEEGIDLPYLVIRNGGRETFYDSEGECGLARASLAVECYASTFAAARSLSNQVRLACSGFRGAMGSLFVSSAFVTDLRSITTDPKSGDDVGHPGVSVDLDIMHTETAATP